MDLTQIPTNELLKMHQANNGVAPVQSSYSGDLTKIPTGDLLKMHNQNQDPNSQPGTSFVNPQGQSEVNAQPLSDTDKLASAKSEWLQKEIDAGRVKPVEPSYWEKFKSNIPATTGGIAGAIAADRATKSSTDQIPNPLLKFGAKAGIAAGGAFLGGFGGEAGHQMYIRNENGAQPKSLGDMFRESVNAGEGQAIGEVAGRGIIAGAGKVLAPLAGKLKPEYDAIKEAMSNYGVWPTPAQATKSRLVGTLEGVGEKALLTSDDLEVLKNIKQPAAFDKYIDDVAKNIGKGVRHDPEATGNLLDATLTGKRVAFDAATKVKYGQLDELAKNIKPTVKTTTSQVTSPLLDDAGKPFTSEVTKTTKSIVDMQPVREAANTLNKQASISKGLGAGGDIQRLVGKAAQLGDASTFSDAVQVRSDILQEARNISSEHGLTQPDAKLLRAANVIADKIDGQMELAAKTAPDLEVAWRAANKFKREGEEVFNQKIVQSLAKNLSEAPASAVAKVFKDPTQTKAVFDLVDEPTKTALRSSYFEQMINDARKATSETGETTWGSKLKRIVTDDKNRAVMKEAFEPEHIKDIDTIADWGMMTQTPTKGGGAMLIQLTQAGAVANLAALPFGHGIGSMGEREGATGALLLTPTILSKLMASKQGAYWLSRGVKLPANSPMAGATLTKLGMLADKASQEDKPVQYSDDSQLLPKDVPAWKGRYGN